MKRANDVCDRNTEVTKVIFFPVAPTEKGLIGFANCLFSHQLALNSIAVYTNPTGSGIRLVFPQRRLPNGLAVNVFHPVTREVTAALTKAIDEKIQKVTKNVDKD